MHVDTDRLGRLTEAGDTTAKPVARGPSSDFLPFAVNRSTGVAARSMGSCPTD
ncbi:hypothetical protein ACFQ0X_00135 [Streptomyces rectiviolaceus]|uniref:hypothetical protein n=1 Tax=Streptomyces rectiviolaceus TaxID=332591 RepID=UPI0036441E50